MDEPYSQQKEKISIVGVSVGFVIYFILFLSVWVYGTRINYLFTFLIPLILIPIISAFIASYLTGNVYDGFIAVIIAGLSIIILLYSSSWVGLFLKKLLYPDELDQNESWLLFVGGIGFFIIVLPIAYLSLGGAFLGSKLAILILEKRDKVSKEISHS